MKEILNEPYGKQYDNLLIDTSLFTIKARKQLKEKKKTYNIKVRSHSIKKQSINIKKKNFLDSSIKNNLSHHLKKMIILMFKKQH